MWTRHEAQPNRAQRGRLALLLSALALAPGWVAAQTTCNGVPATIVGTAAGEVITGTDLPDVIAGLGGDDTINGLKGNDLVCGDNGNDIVNAGFGEDIVYGGRGNDTLNGDKGEDHLYGDLGTDTLNGGVGEDFCDGGVGEDSAPGCETADNVGLVVKKVAIPIPGGFVSLSGAPPTIPAGTVFPNLDGALFLPQNARKVAVLVTHGASGRFNTAIPGWLGWWLELYDVATLSLNRRDSSAYGNNEGGGGTIYEDTLCDAGRGVDYLVSLGFEKVIIVGHSKGTTVSPVYPSYYTNCPGKAGMTDANDPNVAGAVAIGTVANSREAGLYAPYGAYYYDVNGARAITLVSTGYGDLLFPPGGFPAFGPPVPIFGPQFFIQPPGFPVGPPPLPAIPIASTPRSYASYNGPTTRRNVDVEALNLASPFLVIHAEGDRTTLRAWSDRLVNDVLVPAGKDVTYETPLYESLGYPNPGTGGDAHSLTAEPSRFDATSRINTWASGKFPLYGEVSGAVDVATIQALPDFVPALQPSPTNP